MNPVIRYFVFGTFIVCNAIIASMAIWNISLAEVVHLRFPVDEYLASVGALGLVVVFTSIFVELARPNAVTGLIWFECTWVGIFWIMELAGGIALAATVPGFLCSRHTRGSRRLFEDACTSTRVLMAFTWICTATLFCYLVTLTVTSYIHRKRQPRIWHSHIHDLPSFGSQPLVSPTLPRFKHNTPTIVAPKPRHPAPAHPIYSYRSGLSSEYAIEQYSPSNQPRPSQVAPSFPTVPPPVAQQPSGYPAASLYPQYLHSSLERQPQRTQPSQMHLPHGASPPPLGDWPRANVLSEPLRKTRKKPGDQPSPASALNEVRSPPSEPRRPSGPRRSRGGSGSNRPPPLDLSNISTYNRGR